MNKKYKNNKIKIALSIFLSCIGYDAVNSQTYLIDGPKKQAGPTNSSSGASSSWMYSNQPHDEEIERIRGNLMKIRDSLASKPFPKKKNKITR